MEELNGLKPTQVRRNTFGVTIAEEYNLDDGRIITRSYWGNKHMSCYTELRDSEPTDVVKELIYRKCFREDGMLSDRYYREDGKKKKQSFYKNGMLHTDEPGWLSSEYDGIYTEYSESGIVIMKREYKNGVLDGTELCFNSDGIVSNMRNYKNGSLDGESLLFDDDGMTISRQNYSNYRLNGTTLRWRDGACFRQNYYDDCPSDEEVKVDAPQIDGKILYPTEKLTDVLWQAPFGEVTKDRWECVYVIDGVTYRCPYEDKSSDGNFEVTCYYGEYKVRIGQSYSLLNGTCEVYGNGTLRMKQQFVDGKKQGEFLQWDSKCDLFCVEVFQAGVYVNGSIVADDGCAKDTSIVTKENPEGIRPASVPVSAIFDNKTELWSIGSQYGEYLTEYTQDGCLYRKRQYVKGICLVDTDYYKDGTISTRRLHDKEVTEIYANGKIVERHHYKGNVYCGLQEKWHENGVIKERTVYDRDSNIVSTETFDENGKRFIPMAWYKDVLPVDEDYAETLTIKHPFNVPNRAVIKRNINNERVWVLQNVTDEHVNVIEFDLNGDMNSQISYNKKSLLMDGICLYYTNDKLFQQGFFTQGKRRDLWATYSMDGKLYQTYNYKEGVLDGLFTEYYYGTDMVNFTKWYKDGKANGEFNKYNKSAKLIAREFYKDDVLNGESVRWDDDGNITKKTFYKDGIEVPSEQEDIESIDENENDKLEFVEAGDSFVTTYSEEVLDKVSVVRTFYDDGTAKKIAHFKNGKICGECTEYFKSGNVHSVRYYKDGELEGLRQDFDDEGHIVKAVPYKSDNMQGVYREWSNGSLVLEKEYKNDILDGYCYGYSANGNLVLRCFYKCGFLNGKYEEFYDNKKLCIKSCKKYVDGILSGEVITYYESGAIKSYENFTTDKQSGNEIKNGTTTSYYEDGQMDYKCSYSNGNLNGKYEKWYPNGVKERECSYKDGLLNGEYATWFDNGAKCSLQSYCDGKLLGERTAWNRDGVVACIENYNENGNLSNNKYLYYDDGKLKTLMFFVDGKLDGKYMEYYQFSGSIRFVRNYENGWKKGEQKEFFENGQLDNVSYCGDGGIMIGLYKSYYMNGLMREWAEHNIKGELDGKHITWHRNGVTQMFREYVSGKRHGISKLWNDKGEILANNLYDNGEVVNND